MSLHHNPKIVADNLILYFDAKNPKSYVGSGTSVNDLAKSGEIWTMTPEITMGTKGFNFLLNTNAKSIVTTSSYSLGTSGDLTYSWWVKLSSGGSTYPSLFFDRGQGVTAFVWVYVNGDSLDIQASNSVTYSANSSSGFFTGLWDTWLNIAIVYSYSANSSVIFYKNGVAVTTQTAQGIRLFPNQVTTKNVGCYGGSAGHNWTGEIATMGLYNRALTATEIKQNYNALKGRFGLT